jgi:hypothetical protein
MPIVCYSREEILNMVDESGGFEPLFLSQAQPGDYEVILEEIEDPALRDAVQRLRDSVLTIDNILGSYADELGRE